MAEIAFIVIAFCLLFSAFTNNRAVYIIACMVLFFIAAYRTIEVGTDTLNYESHFIRVQNGIYEFSEPLWIALLVVVDYFGGDFRSVLILSSALTLLPIYWCVYKYSKNPLLSLYFYYTLYFYFYSFNIMRQSIAVSLVFVALMLLIHGRRYYYIIIVVIAGLFHYTALLALGLLYIDKFPKYSGAYLFAIAISFVAGIFLPGYVIQLGTTVLPYANYSEVVLGGILGNTAFLLLLNTLFVFIMLINSNRDYYFNIFFVFIVMSNILVRIPYGGRIVMYFSILCIIFYVNLIYNNNFKQKVWAPIVIVVYSIIMFYRRYGFGEIFPYENVLLNIL